MQCSLDLRLLELMLQLLEGLPMSVLLLLHRSDQVVAPLKLLIYVLHPFAHVLFSLDELCLNKDWTHGLVDFGIFRQYIELIFHYHIFV